MEITTQIAKSWIKIMAQQDYGTLALAQQDDML